MMNIKVMQANIYTQTQGGKNSKTSEINGSMGAWLTAPAVQYSLFGVM